MSYLARLCYDQHKNRNLNFEQTYMENPGNNHTGFELVKGEFTTAEAREVLTNLINSKLRFHSKKNLQAYEQSGKTDPNSESRIQELKQLRKQLLEDLNEAREEDCMVELQASINLKFLKPVRS
ncbi:hypothetical protein G3570_00380 [Balneolaceae bacterium YR4-1]|uniref:Uncharacterized protein n=1 Tax=Halalkalibaculum roseum TaxID=2709311 RepID=A0A6M1SQJ2_9BACT|nr:hypothetical protein [Halalkalibaculum roseum]NGP75070.1 hypothetical protein [Halalkalibaculum roseum]